MTCRKGKWVIQTRYQLNLLIFLFKDVLQQSSIVDVFNHITISIWGLNRNTVRSDWVNTLCIQLEESGAYEISYKVTTDQDTLVNPTNHSYFNLSGDFTQTVDRHVFQLNTEGIYPIAPDGVPDKTPDATRDVVKHIYNGALLKDIFAEEDEQLQLVSGLDHPFALPAGHDNAGFLYDQNSGRFLLFKTEAPCFVVYTANFVDESVIIGGQPMVQHNGIALEAQALPDAIHSDLKDQVILKAGQTFTSKTRYELVVK